MRLACRALTWLVAGMFALTTSPAFAAPSSDTAPSAQNDSPAPRLIFGLDRAGDLALRQNVDWVWAGRHYCWYGAGWHGPGYYWCGFAWRRGYGWGGPAGWGPWRHARRWRDHWRDHRHRHWRH